MSCVNKRRTTWKSMGKGWSQRERNSAGSRLSGRGEKYKMYDIDSRAVRLTEFFGRFRFSF